MIAVFAAPWHPMTPSSSSTAEFSVLMWVLAALTAVLAVHISLGWVRVAHRRTGLREQWRPLLLAAMVLGTGLCAAVVLSLSAEALAFPIGYRAIVVPGLWLGAMAVALPVVYAVARSQRWWSLVLCGTAVAALAAAVQVGWMLAAGFRPGIFWRAEFVATALILMCIGCGAGLWVGFSSVSRDGERRTLWRLGASALVGLSVLAGQEIFMTAAGLVAQVGSVYLREVPSSILSLVCGVVVPLILAVMGMDLYMRRPKRRRSSSDPASQFSPQKRRKRRHRVQSL
jgi:NO-binding membrane sensor protein with MHYT domain